MTLELALMLTMHALSLTYNNSNLLLVWFSITVGGLCALSLSLPPPPHLSRLNGSSDIKLIYFTEVESRCGTLCVHKGLLEAF